MAAGHFQVSQRRKKSNDDAGGSNRLQKSRQITSIYRDSSARKWLETSDRAKYRKSPKPGDPSSGGKTLWGHVRTGISTCVCIDTRRPSEAPPRSFKADMLFRRTDGAHSDYTDRAVGITALQVANGQPATATHQRGTHPESSKYRSSCGKSFLRRTGRLAVHAFGMELRPSLSPYRQDRGGPS